MTRTAAARTLVAAAMLAAAPFALAGTGAALACPPEIVFDPETGMAEGQAELEAARAELTKSVHIAAAGR